MIKAPRGHTSIYFSDYLKANIATLHQVMHDKGFTSFNSFFNTLVVNAIQTHDGKRTVKKPDVFNDSNISFKESCSNTVMESYTTYYKQSRKKEK